MTKEQKKAIDACKDQAAKEFYEPITRNHFKSYDDAVFHLSWRFNDKTCQSILKDLHDRAMQLYGEQCRKEGPIPEEPVQGPWMECHRCGESCRGTYNDVPTCFDCARGLGED